MTKILIVEDDPMISEIYEKKFETVGFEVVVATNGMEVMKRVAENKFDLVLLDMVLPEMSGIDILKNLKSYKSNPDMRVVMFTNLSEKSDRDEALKCGADGFISKTQYNPSELVAEIQRMLKEFGEMKKNETRAIQGNVSKDDGVKKKGKILFIEDEDIFIDMIGKKLSDEGYEMTFAKNGSWAIKKAMEEDFDLIITDMILPTMGGEEIIKKLRLEEKTKNIPIIVVSASLSQEEINKMKKYDVDECYLKTHIVPSDLSRKIEEILNNRK